MWVCNSSHNGKLLLQIFPLKHFQEQFLFRIKKWFWVRSARLLFQTLEKSIPGIHWTAGPLQDTELETRASRVNPALELLLEEKPNTVNCEEAMSQLGIPRDMALTFRATHGRWGPCFTWNLLLQHTWPIHPQYWSLWIIIAGPY